MQSSVAGQMKMQSIEIARRIVDVTNVRARHYWIDIRTNSKRCR